MNVCKPRLLPNPSSVVGQSPSDSALGTAFANTEWQQGPCSCCGLLAEVKSAVDDLALRQEKLLDRIDEHYQKMVQKVSEPMEFQQSESQHRALARFPTTVSKSRPTSLAASRSICSPVSPVTKDKSEPSVSFANVFDRWKSFDVHHLTEGGDWAETMNTFVHTRRFECFSGCVISINMVFLFAQLELQSCEAAMSLGHLEDGCEWPRVRLWFKVAEIAFNVWYLLELLLRIFASRWKFFIDRLNIVDVVVVCTAGFQYAFAEVQFLGVAPLRFFRVFRALRVVRIIRLLAIFKELHILLWTLGASFRSLQWSICLLGAIVWSSGLLVMQLLDPHIQDTTEDFEIRESLYLDYGTPLRAGYSMFVAAFSSQWVPPARQMIEHVHPSFALFWILYIVMVNFMVIRVIAALFLKQTLDVASQDSERRAMAQQKHREKFAAILHELFTRCDTSGDGKISKQEFKDMVDSKHVLHKFEILGLDYEEVCALFDVLCSDDGFADYEEFLSGAMLMNSSARAFDTIRITHQLGTMMRSIYAIERRLGIASAKADK